jgi:hypothetical protein
MALPGKVVSTTGFPEFPKLTQDRGALGWNGIIFGPPGVGKTTLALSAQNSVFGKEVLLIDVDEGRESVLDLDVAYTVPKTWLELRQLVDTAVKLKDGSPYKTYVFDSLTSIYHELLMPKVAGGADARIELQHYNEAQKMLTKLIRDMRSLIPYGINSIFLGHVLEEKENIGSKADPSYITNVRLNLPEKVRDQILSVVNHVAYYQRARGNGDDREVYFKPPTTRVAGPKIRQPKTAKQLDLTIKNPDMGSIFDHLRNN